jgi:Glycosyl transferase family 11
MANKNFVFITGGLGNQLFQLSAGLSVSRAPLVLIPNPLNARKWSEGSIDIEAFTLPNRGSFWNPKGLRKFGLKTVNYSLRHFAMIDSDKPSNFFELCIRILTSIIVSINLKKLLKVAPNRGLGFDPKIQSLKSERNFLIGYFQSYKYLLEDETISEMRNLKLKEANSFIDEYRDLAELEIPLVVHVRLGDYRSAEAFGLLPASYYEIALKQAWADNRYRKIWLFSDEPMQALERIPDFYREFVRVIPELDESTATAFELMRLGKGYVIANSTFSWWGAMLSHGEDPAVFCPERWFAGATPPKDLIPPSWHKVETWTL